MLSVLEEYPEKPEIAWLEAGLHDMPKKLNEKIQEELDRCEDCDAVLLVMGTCGNSVVGITSRDYQLIIPRVDDCISLLLGSMSAKQAIRASCFMTAGWLRKERNLRDEFLETLEKYGEEEGKEIYSMLVANYRYLTFIDTGCYDMKKARDAVAYTASELKLEVKSIPGTLDYLRQFLDEKWSDERFICIQPNTFVTESDCCLL